MDQATMERIVTSVPGYGNIKEFQIRSVAGGDINQSFVVIFAKPDQGDIFVKVNASVPQDFFAKEVLGLEELQKALKGSEQSAEAKGSKLSLACRVPQVLASFEGDRELPPYLVLQYIKPGRKMRGSDVALGRCLALIHSHHAFQFGLSQDNYIGKTPQKNGFFDSWADFFIQRRLEVQWQWLRQKGYVATGDEKVFADFVDRLPGLLPTDCVPSLVHGDLWSGNVMTSSDGSPVFIDPAVYYGHAEVDLAMTTMFGRFPEAFYRSYAEVLPLDTGYEERFAIYNTYHLLNHANLFHSRTYYEQALSIMRRYG